tara:strand:- start:884 stop:1123 length:240 start_codon:yes stop_codon:yes gene_type:complete
MNTHETNEGSEVACASACYAKKDHWAHWLWQIPLAITCSPIGIIVFWHTIPEFTWIPFAGLVLALCASATESIGDDSID